LLLVSGSDPSRFARKEPFVAVLDGSNTNVKAIDRGTQVGDEDFDGPWLVFSSGSSGTVKGLMLGRRGVEENLEALVRTVGVRHSDRLLLFLPMSNFQQRAMYYCALWYGFDLIVTEPARVFHALKELHPTVIIAPPAFYDLVEARFYNLPPWKRRVAQTAGRCLDLVPFRKAREALARRIFRDVYATFGDVRLMITGMAPIKRVTLDLFALMRLPLFETYGLAETGSVAINHAGANRIGSVGLVLPGKQVDIAVDGEIIVRQEHMFTLRYFEAAEGENERVFVGGNRVATGDIGRFDRDGYLYLVGRKKEIIVTSDGRKLHPEVLEAQIERCPAVAKSVVYGGPGAPYVVAIVLPKDPADASSKSQIEAFVNQGNHRVSPFNVGRIVFTDQPFSRENGFLLPNLKLDRRRIAAHFRSELVEIQ
jgi:long-subunit acyl-CoA synthetase (AMP-forming)